MEEQQQEEQLCRMGDEADVLLKTEAFNATINQLVDVSFQAFCNSKPEDKDARERSYAHYRALVDIVSTLQQRVQVRDEINAKVAANDNSKEE
tara:strand:- start:1494 stop:1772 length:279 start_codon:yes stop_codon:yes gene_type:complete